MDEFYEEQERALFESLAPTDDPFELALERVRSALRDAIAATLVTQGHELPMSLDGLETPDAEHAGRHARETLIEEQWAIARLAELDPEDARKLVSAIASSSLVVEALLDEPSTPLDLLWLLGRIVTAPREPADDDVVERGALAIEAALAAEEAAPEQIGLLLEPVLDDVVAAVQTVPSLRGEFIELLAERPGLLAWVGTEPSLAPLLGTVNELLALGRFGPYARRAS